MANSYQRHQLMGMRPINTKPRPYECGLVDSLVQNGLADIVRRRRLPTLVRPPEGERFIQNGSQRSHEHELQNGRSIVADHMANGAKHDINKRLAANGFKNEVTHRTLQHDASADSEEPIRQQLDGQDLEWKLKDRSVLDSCPVSAPVDTGSQSNEGFKRFYKAVVSPTHVRVTAGGRIVPNPRGSSSPTGKGLNEKPNGDALSLVLARPASQVSTSNVAATSGSSHQAPVPAGFPGMMPPSMSMGGMPMMSFPFGYPMPPMPMAPAGMLPVQDADKSSKNGDTKTDKGSTETAQPARVNTSALSGSNPGPFFTPSAQPYLHGMPVPMSVPMVAPHPGLPAFAPGAMPPMPPQMPFTPVYGPMQWQGGQFPQHLPMPMPMSMPMPMPMPMPVPMPFPGIGPMVNGQHLHAPTAPSPSSIVMSEVTRKHIENFRAQLKWVDNQLQYNKHQVDENFMKHLGDGIRTQLKAFEKNLESQLEHEAKQRGKGSSKDSSSTRELSKSTSVVSENVNEADPKGTSLGKKERRAKTAVTN